MTAIPTVTPYFYPEQNATIAATTTTANVQLGAVGDTLVVFNDGVVNAFLSLAAPTAVAAVAGGTATLANDGGFCIPPGAIYTIRIDTSLIGIGPVFASAITASGTTTLRISRGSGV